MNGCLEQMADEGHVHVYIAQLGPLATDFKKIFLYQSNCQTTETQEGGGELCFSCDPRVSVLRDNVSDS